jgi:antitoxin FitA
MRNAQKFNFTEGFDPFGVPDALSQLPLSLKYRGSSAEVLASSAKLYLIDNQTVADMTSITIDIPDNQLQKLQDLAKVHGVSPQELLRASLEDWLSSPKPEFSNAVNYVLKKNTELYQRLA